MSPNTFRFMLGMSLGALVLSCEAEEAITMSVPVIASGKGIVDVENDNGDTIRLTQAQIAVDTFTFSSGANDNEETEGTLASALTQLTSWLVPQANAHPGHTEGGAVLGELAGHHVLTFTPNSEQALGDATFLLGDFTSLNWVFSKANVDDVGSEDPLLGHTAVLFGEAQRGDEVVEFSVVIDAPEDRKLEDVPCDFTVDEAFNRTLLIELLPQDPFEDDTLFDGVDFFALDDDGDGIVQIDPNATSRAGAYAYNQLRRTLLTHDHYGVVVD